MPHLPGRGTGDAPDGRPARAPLHELADPHRIASVFRAADAPRLVARSPALLPQDPVRAPQPPEPPEPSHLLLHLLLLRARQPGLPLARIQIPCLSQRRSVSLVIPRSSAIWRGNLPLVRASPMASARTSSGDGCTGRDAWLMDLPPRGLDKAGEACANSEHVVEDHFVEVTAMIATGKGAHRAIDDVLLSRYACYLIVQSAGPSKPIVAHGQTYFAVRTRAAELIELEGLSEPSRAARCPWTCRRRRHRLRRCGSRSRSAW